MASANPTTSSPQDIVLFDLPSKGRCSCWSLNPWKTRLLLNYKGIPYTTEWVEYPDIRPKFEALGLPPNESGTAYTIPTIILPSPDKTGTGEVIMDSAKIARALEERYPSPPLYIDNPAVPKVTDLIQQLLPTLRANAMHLIPDLLNPPSEEYTIRTRTVRLGMTPLEYHQKYGGEQCWRDAEPVIGEMIAMLKEDESGPFVLGKTVSYADFHIVSTLKFLERIDVNILERVLAFDPVLGKLYDACQPWLQKDQ